MKTNQAPQRLAKKLSAMRAVLSKDEREVLDEIIQDDAIQSEVSAHAMKLGKATKASRASRASRATEVAAHTMPTEFTPGLEEAKTQE